MEATPVQTDREDLWKQLSHAVTMRTAGDQVVWTVCSVFSAANAVLLVALFPEGQAPSKLVGLVVGSVGFVLALAWGAIQKRVLRHLDRYEDIARTLEDALRLPAQFRVTAPKGMSDDPRYFTGTFRARPTLSLLTVLAVLFWFSVIGVNLTR
jgi:hypothetical protein